MKYWLFLALLVACTTTPAVYYDQPAPSFEAPPQVAVPERFFSLAMVNGRPDVEQIRVPQGTRVLLEVSSLENETIFFVVDGYDVQEQLVPGSRVLIRIDAEREGLFHYGARNEIVKGSFVVT